MTVTIEQIKRWMQGEEDEHIEFKTAKISYEFDKLAQYCAALSNEGGGSIVLGITDKRPRKVVGTNAFNDLNRVKSSLLNRLQCRISVDELHHPQGRVLVFTSPSHPIGRPVHIEGKYLMRAGESLVPMSADVLKRFFDEEDGPDFSAMICDKATLSDLDAVAIDRFRAMWMRKSMIAAIDMLPDDQLLKDSELLVDGQVTYAALILFGTRTALGKYLAQSEVIFEYRSNEASLSSQQREEFREGFFLYYDQLWNLINLRNDIQEFQDGLFRWDVPTFNEAAVREGILNAVSHRDYRSAGNVFVRQYPRKLEITSPGGFPPGITIDNILREQLPRNRRIAEAFSKCGLVERSGQGVDRMFRESIKESKPTPDFSGTDDHKVDLALIGDIYDPQFLQFLKKIGNEKMESFTTDDFLLLDSIHREQPIAARLKDRIVRLVDVDVIEKVGRGRGTRYLLSKRFYGFLEKRGDYTRKRGLDRETNKALLVKHLAGSGAEGVRLGELMQVLPSLTRRQVQKLLDELKTEGHVHSIGTTRASRWYLGASIAQAG